jgi:hypothetical protein
MKEELRVLRESPIKSPPSANKDLGRFVGSWILRAKRKEEYRVPLINPRYREGYLVVLFGDLMKRE